MRRFAVIVVEHLGAILWRIRPIFGWKVDANRINPQLWTGGTVETRADVAQLVRWGITADIDCQEEHDDLPVLGRHSGIAYLWAPESDNGEPKPVAWFGSMWRFAKPILTAGGVVLVHCGEGHNRGPSGAYFLLRAWWGYSPEQARQIIQLHRPAATIAYARDADRALRALQPSIGDFLKTYTGGKP